MIKISNLLFINKFQFFLSLHINDITLISNLKISITTNRKILIFSDQSEFFAQILNQPID